MVLAVNIHDNATKATYPSSPSNQSISTADAAQQLERLLDQMEDVSERPPGWLADEVAGKSTAPSSTDGQRSPDALKLRSGGGRNPNAAQQRVPTAIGRPSCRATVPTRPGHSHSIKPGFSMIPENPTEEGREGRGEDENGARAEKDGEESCGSCGSMDDEESAKPPVPTSFSAKPNPMMDYVPQYNLCKKNSQVKVGKKKKKRDGVHGGGEKIDVDQALEHYYEMEKLLPGETPPIITMSSSASTETLEPVDLAQLKTVLDSEPQSEIDSMYAQIIEGIREEIEDFEAAENREDKVDMLLQCYGSFAGDSTLASDIDDDTIATEKDDATTRMKTKSFDASSKASSSGRSRFSVPSSFSKVTRAIKPFGRLNRRASTDIPKSSKTASPGLPPPGRAKAPISSKAARAEGLYEKSQQPMDKKSDSCHSDSCELVVIVPSSDEDSLRVQLNSSQNEEKLLLYVEIGHELANEDEPTVPGRQTYFLPGTSKDEIEGPPNAGIPAVAVEEITEDKTETPSKAGGGGSPPAIDKGAAENAGMPSELPSDADIADKKKKRDLSKGFEVVRIRTGKEKIRPSTRTNKYVPLSKKVELEEKEQTKAEKEAEKARKEAEKEAEKARKEAEKEAEKARKLADKKAEKIRKEAEKKEKEKKKLRETARMDEERFAARQQMGARNDVANYNAPTPKRGNKSAKPNSPRFKSESSNESLPKVDRAKARDKALKGETPAKVSFKDEKSPKNQKNTSHASGKGVKPKKMSKQRGRTQKRSLAPVIETASSESSSVENRPTANVEKAPSHRRFKSPLRLKKFTAGDEAKEGEQGKAGKQLTPTPSPRNAKSPKKQGMRSNIADRKKKSEASKPDEPKSKTLSVSRSPGGYIPLAERAIRFSSTADEVVDESSSSSSSDEDDVRDESESPRRGQSGRGSRRLIERDITFETVDSRYDSFGGDSRYESFGGDSRYESFGGDSRYESFGGDSYDGGAFPVSIFDDVIDSLGRQLIGDDGDYKLRRGRRNSIGRSVSSSSYIDGYAM